MNNLWMKLSQECLPVYQQHNLSNEWRAFEPNNWKPRAMFKFFKSFDFQIRLKMISEKTPEYTFKSFIVYFCQCSLHIYFLQIINLYSSEQDLKQSLLNLKSRYFIVHRMTLKYPCSVSWNIINPFKMLVIKRDIEFTYVLDF